MEFSELKSKLELFYKHDEEGNVKVEVGKTKSEDNASESKPKSELIEVDEEGYLKSDVEKTKSEDIASESKPKSELVEQDEERYVKADVEKAKSENNASESIPKLKVKTFVDNYEEKVEDQSTLEHRQRVREIFHMDVAQLIIERERP